MWTRTAALLVFCIAGATAQEPSNDPVEVTGTVVNSVNGQPIPGASVVLMPGMHMPQMTRGSAEPNQHLQHAPAVKSRDELGTVTDDGGKFKFTAVLGYGWSLSVSHSAYRAPHTASDIARIQGVNNGGKPEAVTVKLDPLSVVEGKITNEDGEALPGLVVELLKVELKDGRRHIRRYASKTSDDQGAYRLWHLSPGRYYLRAVGTPSSSLSGVAYGPLYFPAAGDLSGAKEIQLGPGENIHADFNVAGRPAYRIRGKFLDSIADRRVSMRLMRGDEEAGNRYMVTGSNSTFDVFDVPPGIYTLQAYSLATSENLFGETQVSVGTGEVSGVTLALLPGVSVSGWVDSMVAPKGRLQLTATYSEPRRLPTGLAPSSQASPDQDGKFILKNLWPGHYDISARSFIGQSFIRSITSGSSDLFASGLTIGSASGSPEPIRVQFAEGAVTVQLKLDETVSDAETVFVALQPKSGTPGELSVTQIPAVAVPESAQVRRTPGIRGNFFMNLAPGDYTMYAWRDSQQVEYRNPAVLAALSSYAVTITIASGDVKEVTPKLIPKGDL